MQHLSEWNFWSKWIFFHIMPLRFFRNCFSKSKNSLTYYDLCRAWSPTYIVHYCTVIEYCRSLRKNDSIRNMYSKDLVISNEIKDLYHLSMHSQPRQQDQYFVNQLSPFLSPKFFHALFLRFFLPIWWRKI